MPHQCTNCGRTFSDGSKEMLSGCPDCGGNKFQFRPDGTVEDDGGPTPDAPDAPTDAPDASADAPDASADDPDTRPDTGPAARAGAAVRDWVGLGDEGDADGGDDDIIVAEEDPSEADAEDRAQASARGDVVSEDELAAVSDDAAANPESRDPSSTDDPPAPDDPGATPDEVAGAVDDDPPTDDPDARADTGPAAPADGADAADRPGLDELREELNEQFESIRIVSPGQYELNLMELYDREEYIISLQEDGRYVIEVPDRWGENADDDE